jgi:hypothetical protein
MPRAISMAMRQLVVDQYKRGISKSKIACNLQIGRTSVHTIISRYKEAGESGLIPNYDNCGKSRPQASDFIYRAVRCMRTWHPNWGGEKIRSQMLMLRPELDLPEVRTFYRWFHWNNQIESKSKTPKQESHWAKHIHEVWQIDAKEEIQTADGQKNCWLNIVDEASGAVIDPPVFPLQKDQ